ncbi:MAG: hypothetical protein ABI220_04980 [Candidatus Saccharimonadales bacterium]
MIIQFNLLPDIKFEFLKTKRLERLIVAASLIATAACIVVLAVLLLVVEVKQKHDISNLTKDITTHANKIKAISGLDQKITVQNQLETLPSLYAASPQTSRIFGYIVKLTPPDVTIGDLSIDFTANTMTIKGAAPGLSSVNAYADSLKRATYDDATTSIKGVAAFNGVTLTSFGRDQNGATYTLDFSFDPLLFQPSENITLNVPKTTNVPKVPDIGHKIFKSLPELTNEGGNQ